MCIEEHEYRGRWFQHYKGEKYRVKNIASLVNTNSVYVVYHSQHSFLHWFIRPVEYFFGKVFVEGVEIPRFKKLKRVTDARDDL